MELVALELQVEDRSGFGGRGLAGIVGKGIGERVERMENELVLCRYTAIAVSHLACALLCVVLLRLALLASSLFHLALESVADSARRMIREQPLLFAFLSLMNSYS